MSSHLHRSTLLLAMTLALLPACSRCAGDEPGGAPPQPSPLSVLYSGCREVWRGPVCVVPEDRRLVLWVPLALTDRVEIVGGAAFGVRPGAWVEGGRQYEVIVPENERVLVVRAKSESKVSEFRLPLRTQRGPVALVQAEAAKENGQIPEAVALVEAALTSAARKDAPLYHSLLARLRLRQGDAEAAATLLHQAVRAHRDAGRVSQAIVDTNALVHALVYNGRRFAEARAALELENEIPGHCDSAYFLAFSSGSLLFEVDDLRRAAAAYEQSQAYADRCGLEDFGAMAKTERAHVLTAAGRWDEAQTLFQEVFRRSEASGSAFELADAATNLGWVEFLRSEAEGVAGDLGEMQRHFETALAAREEANAVDADSHLNLALGALARGDAQTARSHLRSAERKGVGRDPRLELWAREARARLALLGGDLPFAQQEYDLIAQRGRATLMPEAELRGLLGLARIAAKGRDQEAALSTYAKAEELIGESALRIGLSEGRAALLMAREMATREHLTLLVELGRTEQAMALLREARRRSLRGAVRGLSLSGLPAAAQRRWDDGVSRYLTLRERLAGAAADEWQLPRERLAAAKDERLAKELGAVRELDALAAELIGSQELPSDSGEPGEGELLLGIAQVRGGFLALAKDGSGVTAMRFGPDLPKLEARAIAAALEEGLGPRLRAARRIALLLDPALEPIDFHALVIHGQPLGLSAAVFYSLDLSSSKPSAPAPFPKRALVVADPEGNLPGTRAEADAVSAALRASSYEVERLEGSQVRLVTLLAALPRALHFHFAGHAEPMPHAGWGSALRLFEAGRLQPADVLALRRVPRTVVLFGCSTGVSHGSPSSTIGMAQAFVAAGAEVVLATSRPVEDAKAVALARLLYRANPGGAEFPDGWFEALRQAAAEGEDWSALRWYRPGL